MFPLVPGMFPVMFPVQTQYLCGCSRCSHFFRKGTHTREGFTHDKQLIFY